MVGVTLTEFPFIEIVRQKNASKPFDVIVCRCLRPDIPKLGGDSGVPHMHALFILYVFVHGGGLRKQRLCTVCSPTIHVNTMALLSAIL